MDEVAGADQLDELPPPWAPDDLVGRRRRLALLERRLGRDDDVDPGAAQVAGEKLAGRLEAPDARPEVV